MRIAMQTNMEGELARLASPPFDPLEEYETSPFLSFGEVSKSLLDSISLVTQPISKIGTGPANEKLTSSVAAKVADKPDGSPPARRESAIQTAKRPSGRGGARNRGDRETHALTSAQINSLKAAERHAREIGLPFTRMVTIHWERAGVALANMVKATVRFVDLLSKALRRHGSATAWLCVHEGGVGKGGHCHLLVHVPASLSARITRLQRKWLRTISGKPYRNGVIYSKPIGGWLGLDASNEPLLDANLETVIG